MRSVAPSMARRAARASGLAVPDCAASGRPVRPESHHDQRGRLEPGVANRDQKAADSTDRRNTLIWCGVDREVRRWHRRADPWICATGPSCRSSRPRPPATPRCACCGSRPRRPLTRRADRAAADRHISRAEGGHIERSELSGRTTLVVPGPEPRPGAATSRSSEQRLHSACGDIPPAEFEAAYQQRLQATEAA